MRKLETIGSIKDSIRKRNGLNDDQILQKIEKSCMEGKLTAYGIRLQSGRYSENLAQTQIPRGDWDAGEIRFTPHWAMIVEPKGWKLVKNGCAIWANIKFDFLDIENLFPNKTYKKRGPKEKLPWREKIYPQIYMLMNHHGPFSPDDPEWNAQARLEAEVASFIEKTFGDHAVVSESTIRDHVEKALKILESRKADN